MSVYVLTPLAKADIFDIWTYIADHSETAADRVEQAIYEACAFLAEGPSRGHARPDLTPRPLRFWTLTRYPNYTLVYRPPPKPQKFQEAQKFICSSPALETRAGPNSASCALIAAHPALGRRFIYEPFDCMTRALHSPASRPYIRCNL